METSELFISHTVISFLNGDSSYVVSVYYRDEKGNPSGNPDSFSFPTAAKLKKFVSKTLLAEEGETEETPATATAE